MAESPARVVIVGVTGSGKSTLAGRISRLTDAPAHAMDAMDAMDYPRRISLGRLIRRTGRRLITREPICNGNVERVRDVLGRDSIIAWHFRTYAEVGREIDDLAAQRGAGVPPVLRLSSPRASEAWVASLSP